MLRAPLARVLSVDLFIYPTTINVGSKNSDQLKSDAKSFINNLITHKTHYFNRNFSVNLSSLELCNSRFAEKQVSRIDDNFCYYSYGRRLPLTSTSFSVPKGAYCLVKKTFSGDVSGEIGESLFTYFLISEMGLAPAQINHLRAGKRAAFLVPDFAISDQSHSLSTLVGNTTYATPLLVEVKGFTGKLEPNRITHALEQLQALLQKSYSGLIFLSARNQQRRCYDSYILRVEK